MASVAEETRPVAEVVQDNAKPANAVALSPRREAHGIMKDNARLYAMSNLLPEAVRGANPDQAMANCLIALQMADVMGEMPFVVMQNIHIVKGKAGFATQYMIARANASGVFEGRLNWRVDRGDPENLSVTCFAVLAETGEEVEFTVDMAMARADGWASNAKYKSMPEVMLRYRSAAFLIRFYAPDVMLGYRTVDELEDISFAERGNSAERLTGDMLIEQAKEAGVIEGDARPAQTTGEAIGDGIPEEIGGPPTEQVEDAQFEEAAEETDPKAKRLQTTRDAIEAATTLDALKAAEAEWVKHIAAYSDAEAGAIDTLIIAKRKGLGG